MYPKVDVEFNYNEFNKKLNALEKDIRGKARYSGLVSMAAPLKAEIKSQLSNHVVSGALQRSIGHRKIPKSFQSSLGMKPGDEGLYVGSTIKQFHASLLKKRSQAYKMHWLEEGTAPHKIRAKRGGVLKFKGITAKQVNHPGTRALHILKRSNAAMQGRYLGYFAKGALALLKRHGVTLA